MYIKIEMPPYECSKCGNRRAAQHHDWINHGLRDWQECLDCGHDNKPKPRKLSSDTYSHSMPKVIKF